MKVLIVDDSPDALAVAKVRLAKENLDILCARGGEAGLEAAKREKPDLVLLDVDMPDVSGFDVCRAMKSDPELCMVPIIFLTGSASPNAKVEGLDLGAVDYIAKPFDAFELRARVRAALRTKHLQDLLIEHAHIDPLTGLPNRRALTERLAQEWARVQRHGGSLAFIMADIDHFKQVNDRHGHPMGDKVLCEVAQALVSQCRESDLPARYGGDEFSILAPDADAESAAQLAERCRQQIENAPLPTPEGEPRVTASFGVADSAGASAPDVVVKRSDEALYQAKRAGRNRVAVAPAGAPAPTR